VYRDVFRLPHVGPLRHKGHQAYSRRRRLCEHSGPRAAADGRRQMGGRDGAVCAPTADDRGTQRDVQHPTAGRHV